MNCADNSLALIETGKRMPLLKTVLSFCKAINVPIDFVLVDENIEFLYFTLESYLLSLNEKDFFSVIDIFHDYMFSQYRINEDENNNIDLPYKMKEYIKNLKLHDCIINSNESNDKQIFIKDLLSDRIKHYRHLLEFTQQQLADKLGISLHYQAEIENKIKIPSLQLFKEICLVMKVPAYCLLQSDKESFYYSNREMYDKIRTYDISKIKSIISILDTLTNTYNF